MSRAAEVARKTAIQTDTNLMVVINGQLNRVPGRILSARAAKGSDTPE